MHRGIYRVYGGCIGVAAVGGFRGFRALRVAGFRVSVGLSVSGL